MTVEEYCGLIVTVHAAAARPKSLAGRALFELPGIAQTYYKDYCERELPQRQAQMEVAAASVLARRQDMAANGIVSQLANLLRSAACHEA